jgi:phasin family protein
MADNPFNPFASFDLSKAFDPSKFDITKLLGDLKLPGIDMEALLNAQRKNIEALTAANRVALEGIQAIARRQAEITAQALTEVSSMAQQLTLSGNPQEMGNKQAEVVKQTFEKAMANMRELAEMFSKANSEAFEVLNKRFTESLEELKALVMPNK